MMSIGPHRLTQRSIEHVEVDAMLAQVTAAADRKVQVFYSDPPWGDGNLRYWATMNAKMNAAPPEPAIGYEALVDRIFDLIERYVDGHVFIETGKRWAEPMVARFSKSMHHVERLSLRYRSGSRVLENVLVYGATRSGLSANRVHLEGITGAAVSARCLMAVGEPGAIAFDPCCGMGYTARAALAAGMVFAGNEFNAKRLEKTEALLRSHVSAVPFRAA